jgi:hypothetical protein
VTKTERFPVMAGLVLFPTALFSDAPGSVSCVQALEQEAALHSEAPVYKLTANGERSFLSDADRPAQITRFQEVIRASCSTDPTVRSGQEAAAARLKVALSPECANERDRLTAMQQPSSREPADAIAQQRKLVADNCPSVDARGLWLVQWMGRSDLR